MQFPLEEFNEYWPQFNMKKHKTGCIKKKKKNLKDYPPKYLASLSCIDLFKCQTPFTDVQDNVS